MISNTTITQPNISLFGGYRVQIAKPYTTQNVMLCDKVCVTDEFRQSINEWMKDFFGVKHHPSPVKDGEVLSYEHQKTIVMNESTYQALQQSIMLKREKAWAGVLSGNFI